jgi:hypothetical protein
MIEDIQKIRFLNNLYRSFYSYGNELDELTIKRLYTTYFRQNPPGSPMPLDAEVMRSTSVANIDYINNIMAKALYNMDVLYDAAHENIEELYSTVTSLNNRIDSLRSKRTKLEKKVDDLIFSITNSDGFYASFSEEFTDLDSIDTKYSSVYFDTDSRSISLSSISSGSFNQAANNVSKSNSVKRTTYFNGKVVENSQDIGTNASLMFDGLSDTYFKHTYKSSSPGICSIKLDITPLSSPSISKVFGRLSSDKKITTMLQINSSITGPTDIPIFSAQSENDFDNFVFQFEPVSVSSISLFLIKNEPDRLTKSNNSTVYEYDFIIRDIVLAGLYYDLTGTYVSNPITIYTDNGKNVIDAISVDVKSQNVTGNDVSYFIAKNNPSATSVDDFQWIPISPTNELNKSYPSVVSFNGSNLVYKTISKTAQQNTNELFKYFSTKEETNLPGFEGSKIHRVAKMDKGLNPIEPLILEGYNRYVWHKVDYEEGLCVDVSKWKNDVLTNSNYNVVTSTSQIGNTSSFWTAPSIDSGGSVYISFDILSSSTFSVQKLLTKDDDNSLNWDLAVYLNGSLIKRISPNVSSETIIWNFIEGINNVTICIDAKPKPTSSSNYGLYGSFSLMQQSRISEYGLIYQKYLTYVAPELFKNSNNIVNNSFSIATIDTEKYIISNREIVDGSRLYYYTNNTDSAVDSVRFRIDMNRNPMTPKSSPIVTSYRVKFRRTQMLKDTAKKTASEILRSNG